MLNVQLLGRNAGHNQYVTLSIQSVYPESDRIREYMKEKRNIRSDNFGW